MAKARQQMQQPPADQQPMLMLDDDTISAESLNPALEALYSELGMTGETEATVHVSMLMTDGKGVEAGVWKGDPGEYDLQTIAQEHGSGQYRVKVYVRNPDGSKPCRANRIFAWKLTPAEERKRKAAEQAPVVAAPAEPPMTAKDIAVLITTGIAAALKENAPKVPTRKEMLEEMSIMAAMFKPANSGGGNDFSATMRNFEAFANVMRTLSPPQRLVDEDGKVDQGAIIMQGLKVFGDALAARNSGTAVVPQPPAGQPVMIVGDGQVMPAAPAQDQVVTQQQWDEAMLMLKLQLKAAVTAAKAGMDAKEFANDIFEMLPDDAVALLQNDPNWMQKLIELNADVGTHQDWFKQVAAEVLRLEAEDTGTPAAGS